MTRAQLRAFHNVALHDGFSRAAEALLLTQPAISDQVRKLEQDYDLILFDRQKKQVTLTAKGQALFEITRRLFEIESEAEDYLNESRALSAGTLRLIVDSAHHVTDILARFRARYPGVRVTLRTGNSDQVAAALYGYEADIGVVGEDVVSTDFAAQPLGESRIIAFAARSSPWAGGGALSLAQLATLPLVWRETGSRTRRILERGAAAAGLTLPIVIEAEGREAVREIVASGAGVGFVSEAEFGCDARLARIQIDGPPMTMRETMVCLSQRRAGRLVSAFFDL